MAVGAPKNDLASREDRETTCVLAGAGDDGGTEAPGGASVPAGEGAGVPLAVGTEAPCILFSIFSFSFSLAGGLADRLEYIIYGSLIPRQTVPPTPEGEREDGVPLNELFCPCFVPLHPVPCPSCTSHVSSIIYDNSTREIYAHVYKRTYRVRDIYNDSLIQLALCGISAVVGMHATLARTLRKRS